MGDGDGDGDEYMEDGGDGNFKMVIVRATATWVYTFLRKRHLWDTTVGARLGVTLSPDCSLLVFLMKCFLYYITLCSSRARVSTTLAPV